MLGSWPEAPSARTGFAASCSPKTPKPAARRDECRFQWRELVLLSGGSPDKKHSLEAGLLCLGVNCSVAATWAVTMTVASSTTFAAPTEATVLEA
jgi:hypothetical protein